ncbi:Hsp20 family protein [Martelella soudanensis]|uniref:Hsp20 family protein n=1 Tax=unclassified Martelella TaxID=2629616 RepID=UPI0015DDBF4C|nr:MULTISPECIES: Hsp20 family protein [unclassified Martelella]
MPRIDLRFDPRLSDRQESMNAVKGASGYPPFDVAWFPGKAEAGFLRLTLAVAGFAASELDVVIEGSVLIVSGKAEERDEGEYLFRGIAGRQFRRQFALADGMEVVRAGLERGLLSIDLAHRPQEVRKIKISVSQ